ncbi:MAG: oxaloacetate decarboxylase [Pseudomonadota bacterium]
MSFNPKAKQLRQLLNNDDIHVAPGVYDGMTARLTEQAGFNVIYASGGAISRSCGFPDIGLLSFSEVLQRLEQMAEVTKVPIIADADTGFGNAINVSRVVKAFERIGMAGLHLEDQTFPKRCGHLDDKTLISSSEMIHKIRIAKESVIDPNFVIIARTDAIAAENFEKAIERSKAYLKAGADVIFVEAPETVEQIEQIAKQIPEPKLINMFHGGKTPLVPIDDLKAMGYKLIIIPSDLQRASIKACQDTLEEIRKTGDSSAIKDEMTSFSEREQIIRTNDYLAIDDSYKE